MGRWQRLAVSLREEPGEWVLVLERKPKSLVYGSARRSLLAAGCECRCKFFGKYVSLWARWPS